MEYLNKQARDSHWEEEEKENQYEELMNIWRRLYLFQNQNGWNKIPIKQKREYRKIEEKLFKLAKTLYYNDMLLQEGNTTEGTITL